MLKVACLWDVYVKSHLNSVIWLNGHIYVHLYVKKHLNAQRCLRQHIYGTWDVSYRNLIESTINISFLSTTKTFQRIIYWRGSTSGAPPLTKAPLHGVCRVKTSIFFLVLEFASYMLHICVFGPNPFQRTTARFALIM